MEIASWIIGTLILLGLHAFVIMPLAKALSKSRLKGKSLADSEQLINEVSGDTNEVSNEVKIPTGIYIFSDILVMGISGFLIGFVTKSFFIGFSLRAIDWPGMIVFILSSLLGSSL